jgi:hypothetical protein
VIGTGVKPNVAVPTEQALLIAHLLALRKVLKKHAEEGSSQRQWAQSQGCTSARTRSRADGDSRSAANKVRQY